MPPATPAPPPPWPQVPACYGWLSLDRRGCWRLRGEPVAHGGLAEFISRHYGCDTSGNWFVQNGPQRVFVSLAYTPLVLRLDTDDGLRAHTGVPAGAATAAYVDEDGNVLLETAWGIGALDDRDLHIFVDGCRLADGSTADETAILGVMAGAADAWWHELRLQRIRREEVPSRFGFEPSPRP